jgi:hypothetical protein
MTLETEIKKLSIRIGRFLHNLIQWSASNAEWAIETFIDATVIGHAHVNFCCEKHRHVQHRQVPIDDIIEGAVIYLDGSVCINCLAEQKEMTVAELRKLLHEERRWDTKESKK